MREFIIFVLSGSACCLMNIRRPAWASATKRSYLRTKSNRRQRDPPSEALPRLIRQLASLLAAGRTGALLWENLAMVLAVEQTRVPDHVRPSASKGPRTAQQLTELATVQVHGSMEATLQLVLTVQRASALGLPTATAVRNACRTGYLGRSGARRSGLTMEQCRMWLDLAACFDVCEASGAPVAEVLERLANTLESDHDAEALRETALAGPRATVKLLTWLPLLGLGLGMLMGVDPLAALLGSPLGWSVLAVGVVFAVVGRTWSVRMIASAARTTGNPGRRRVAGDPADRGRPQRAWEPT